MKRSWRQRRVRSRPARWWNPWRSLRPSKGRGRRINETKSFGIRDIVASPSEVQARPDLRWRIIGLLFVLLLVLLILRLGQLQIGEHAAAQATVESNSLRVSYTPATRGNIYDRSGGLLVGNTTDTELLLSRAEAALHPSIKGSLASLTGLSVKQINAALNNVQYSPYQPAPILLTTPPALVEFLALHQSEFPGVTVAKISTRTYPGTGSLAPHVLGYVGPIAEKLSQLPKGYQTDSVIGKTGIEEEYEQFLRGTEGTQTLEVNALGQILNTVKTTKAQAGDSVVLNLDAGLQQAVDNILSAGILKDRTTLDPVSKVLPKALNGAAIVLNPNNGQVLAMASYPGYDLTNFTTGLSKAEYNQLIATGAFNNEAIQGLYVPGSTFKLITATAELQSGIMSSNYVVDDTGSFKVPGCLQGYHGCVFHDDDNAGAGPVNLAKALTVSSDYYFYNLGYLFWSQQSKYGLTPIQNVAAKYGLDGYTGIDLPNENFGRVDSPAVRRLLHSEAPKNFPTVGWYTGDNVEMAFGQGSTAVTPIEMANAYATFANGGTVYAPEVAAGVVNAHGRVVLRYLPRVISHVNLPASIREPILQGLTGVVANHDGTASGAFAGNITFSLSSFPIAGKTGTASNQPGQEPNSWFVGFGPTYAPKYVVLCVIEQGGYGADAAAPIVAKIFNYLVQHPVGNVKFKPQLVVPTTKTNKKTTKAAG